MHPPQAGRMSNRHLPAGQSMGGPGAGMGMSGSDMGGGGHAHMGGGGPRRRGMPHGGHGHNQNNFGQHHYQPHPGMYAGYVPYPAQYYQGMPPGAGGYQNGPMPSQGYMQYSQAQYSRSPPTMQPFVPMMGIGSPGYLNNRQSQQSPALATPYQPPPVPPPMASHTPSSTHSHSSPQVPPPAQQPSPAPQQEPSQPLVVSSDFTPSRIATIVHEPVAAPIEPVDIPRPTATEPAVMAVPLSPSPPPRAPFRPPVPWLSRPDLPFPIRTSRKRRKRQIAASELVSLPDQPVGAPGDIEEEPFTGSPDTPPEDKILTPMMTPTNPMTTESSYATSEATSSPAPATPTSTQLSTTPTLATKPVARHPLPAVPAVPIVPVIPKTTAKDAGSSGSDKTTQKPAESSAQSEASAGSPALAEPAKPDGQSDEKPAPIPKTAPKSWASLLTTGTQTAAPKGPASANGDHTNGTATNGTPSTDEQVAASETTTFSKTNASSLVDALRSYKVNAADKVAFIEPRGLINTGNMCYMNSVLQVLIFCVPFYDFLDQVNKKAAHSFKSETPLIDAMVMFLREYKVIDAATSVDQLRRRLKLDEMGQYGEPFIPEFLYEVIRRLPRFVNMRRGHQQDAEEFLGFLLQSLDDECNQAIGIADGTNSLSVTPAAKVEKGAEASDWLEVGRKQRSAISRSSGQLSSSPISRIFGGLLRSELRVPGLKDSITNEPYQPLQLDIGSPKVHNIIDALRHLTAPETIPGDFNPSRPGVSATKHVSIETLPPVLILHLKRFQFDPTTRGTVKLWKKVGYPLELRIPPEVLSRQKRNSLLSDPAGQPVYRLSAVVYHHGVNASVGHYTVDVLRQDDREWIRIDDTQIHRITSKDVAEAGAEDSVSHSRNQSPSGQPANRFGAMNEDDTGHEEGWKPVNSSKRWSSVVNGGTAPSATKTKPTKENVKDNRIAYILFYQRV